MCIFSQNFAANLIKIGDVLSEWVEMTAGMPQGSYTLARWHLLYWLTA